MLFSIPSKRAKVHHILNGDFLGANLFFLKKSTIPIAFLLYWNKSWIGTSVTINENLIILFTPNKTGSIQKKFFFI